MLRDYSRIYDAPKLPAIYALYGGTSRNKYIAYVGIGGDLRSRLVQHFINRDSSVTTGTSAVALNPDFISELVWWEEEEFGKREHLEAAELVAFDVLDPSLRSRGRPSKAAIEIRSNMEFVERIKSLLENKPSGKIIFPSISNLTARLDAIEARLNRLENRVYFE